MSAFTCLSCRVAFDGSEVQRQHYKCDWHIYNLKRKIAGLVPVTAEQFQEKVLAQKAKIQPSGPEQTSHCDVCSKSFRTANAYENHLKSAKHRERKSSTSMENTKNQLLSENMPQEVKNEDKEEEGEANSDSDDETWDAALGLEECLFCTNVADSMDTNMDHMKKAHSFFIPDLEFVTDFEGLMSYLGAKVGEGQLCLWCNEKGRGFRSCRAAQQHMVDKGHCKILFEGDSVFEFSDYYDYSSSYPDGHNANADEPVQDMVLDDEGYEMVLPSGATIGHRSLMRYYQQRLRPDRPHAPIGRLMASSHKALTWTGTTGEASVKRAKAAALAQRRHAWKQMRLGIKANKFQKYFRDDVFGN